MQNAWVRNPPVEQWVETVPAHLRALTATDENAPPQSQSFNTGNIIVRVRSAHGSASKIFRHSGITVAFKTTFEVFTRIGPDNSLERLTERSVGLVTDRPSDVYELFVTLL